MSTPLKRKDTDLGRWTPTAELDRISQELARLFDTQLSPAVPGATEGFVPLADLEETDDAYVLDVELPGVRKKDINVESDGQRIIITGERKQERGRLLRRQTRYWGEFRYEVTLPEEIDPERIEASMNDGVLRLHISKRTARQARRRIEIS